MNAFEQIETRHLSTDTNGIGASGGFFSKLLSRGLARGCNAMLDRMDAGINEGAIEGSLPDGSRRFLGGRGPGPKAEMNIRSWRALVRIGWAGSVGLYEGWAAGEWDSPDPVQIFDMFVRNRASLNNSARPSVPMKLAGRVLHWLRRNSKSGSRRNIEFHYDLGNDFYAAWLDPGMTYSSAIFTRSVFGPVLETETLEQAQDNKNTVLLDRLALNDGDSLLEIGCGWGGLAQAALAVRDIDYHGITLSVEQKAYADHRLLEYKDHAAVTITDYRDVTGQYNAIASVEMVEAVGQAYWPDYLDCISRCLKPGGRAAIQYIAINDDAFEAYAANVDFIQRYIFPGGMLISESRFRKLAQDRGMSWQDKHDFGPDYAETLRRWRGQFDVAVAEKRLPAGFDEKFIGLWRFYLMYCEGGFRGGGIQVSQVTLVKV
jgi:cyclopropane-fatty-acyl-phospholipid synthase